MKQTILVTGASSGFGLLIANKLHESGYNVIGTSRNPERITPSLPFKMIALDIADDDSVRSFGPELFKYTDRVDVLINNAGFYLSGLAEETSIELGRQQFETNFWGTIKVTNALLPHFRKKRSGKIITVGSIVGLLNFPNGAYYGASKHALEGYFKSLRFELNEFNVKVAMVEPMGFKTNIISSSVAADNEIEEYSAYRKKIRAFAHDIFNNAPEPTPVINRILKLVEAKDPKFNHPVGKGASVLLWLQHFAFKTFEKTIIKNINKFQS